MGAYSATALNDTRGKLGPQQAGTHSSLWHVMHRAALQIAEVGNLPHLVFELCDSVVSQQLQPSLQSSCF